jgi:hypothetical protein
VQQVLEFRLQEESKIRCGSGLESREGPENLSKLIDQYGCGPVQFTGTDNALYKRHLFFDNVIDLAAARETGLRLLPAPHGIASRRVGC